MNGVVQCGVGPASARYTFGAGASSMGRALSFRVAQESAALVSPQPRVKTSLRNQRRVVALFDNTSLIKHDQTVHRRDGGQPVRDRDQYLAMPSYISI